MGLTVEALAELSSLGRCKPQWTTNEVCMLLVKSLTSAPCWRHKPTCTNAKQQWYEHAYVDESTGEETRDVPAGTRSYCELLVEQGKGHQVGRARIFVSHAWKALFEDAVSAMRSMRQTSLDNGEEEPFFRFDIATVNQHRTAEVSPKWWCVWSALAHLRSGARLPPHPRTRLIGCEHLRRR